MNSVLVIGDEAFIDVSTPANPDSIARLDAADLPAALAHRSRWRAHRPSGATTYYAVCWLGPRKTRRLQMLHRLLLGLNFGDAEMGDHANGDGLDNRRENLRRASDGENAANIRKSLTRVTGSRFKGVGYHRCSGHWRAYIRLNGRQRHLGNFLTEEEAARAYDVAAAEQHGEFANLNFSGRDTL